MNSRLASRGLGVRWAAALALVATLGLAPRPSLAVDPSANLPLPSWDVAVGLTGGVAFAEVDSSKQTGALVGVDVGLLEGVLGLHLGLRTHREGHAQRLGGLVEFTAWYVVLLGIGCRFGAMLAPGGPDAPDTEVGLTFLIAAPFPIARFDGGRDGALVLAPFARPGLRFAGGGEVTGFHEVGLMVRWTSFGF